MINFKKYQGTGNDFIMIEDMEESFPIQDAKLINKMCTPKFGIGADGLILVRPNKEQDFRMVYFNSDGRESTMCGNGGRCIAHFAWEKGIVTHSMRFMASDGPHRAIVNGKKKQVNLEMLPVKGIESYNDAFVLDTGSPHYVYFVEDIQETDVQNKGHRVRNSAPFKEEGINVNFVQALKSNQIFARTFERGVEAETLSCGTGVVASAIAYFFRHNEATSDQQTIQVNTPGGNLQINFIPESKDNIHDVWLEGPVEEVFEGRYFI